MNATQTQQNLPAYPLLKKKKNVFGFQACPSNSFSSFRQANVFGELGDLKGSPLSAQKTEVVQESVVLKKSLGPSLLFGVVVTMLFPAISKYLNKM